MSMFEVTVSGWFAAAHQLRLLDGSLEPLHGHNWHVRVTWRGRKLDGMGVLVDFTQVKPRLDKLLATFHDRCLNELAPFAGVNPSAENVAAIIAGSMNSDSTADVALQCVEVEEAPGCVARYLTA